ncbi:protein starmaker-like [Trichogramma pretiosum]|uniref:protein starmaker-like n=1 Tax=Trichogramma pretiosum TaxID=7493 RepID=UPI0006C99541|nr:protein starmaker-like [Trichogramma pretiosum]
MEIKRVTMPQNSMPIPNTSKDPSLEIRAVHSKSSNHSVPKSSRDALEIRPVNMMQNSNMNMMPNANSYQNMMLQNAMMHSAFMQNAFNVQLHNAMLQNTHLPQTSSNSALEIRPVSVLQHAPPASNHNKNSGVEIKRVPITQPSVIQNLSSDLKYNVSTQRITPSCTITSRDMKDDTRKPQNLTIKKSKNMASTSSKSTNKAEIKKTSVSVNQSHKDMKHPMAHSIPPSISMNKVNKDISMNKVSKDISMNKISKDISMNKVNRDISINKINKDSKKSLPNSSSNSVRESKDAKRLSMQNLQSQVPNKEVKEAKKLSLPNAPLPNSNVGMKDLKKTSSQVTLTQNSQREPKEAKVVESQNVSAQNSNKTIKEVKRVNLQSTSQQNSSKDSKEPKRAVLQTVSKANSNKSEAKRATLQSLPSKIKDKENTEKEVSQKMSEKNIKPSLRFELKLTPSTDDQCPEFNYAELLSEREKKLRKGKRKDDKITNGDLSDKDDILDVARYFEEKYGHKKRDNVDLGAGYDDEDSFIDNTDAYDEQVPEELTTALGGFYVNSGPLEFKNCDTILNRRKDLDESDDGSDDDSDAADSSDESEGSDEEESDEKSDKSIEVEKTNQKKKRVISSDESDDNEKTNGKISSPPKSKPRMESDNSECMVID